MTEQFKDMNLEPMQAYFFARALYALARMDGIHEHEMALLGSFISDVLPNGAAQLQQFPKTPDPDPQTIAMMLDNPDVRHVFLRTAMLLAYADGHISDLEQQWIDTVAAAMEMTAAMAGIKEEIQEYLIGQLTDISNTDALVEVARELK